jgi:hypothetical protein
MSDQDRYISTDKSSVRTYKQDAFSTTLIFLFSVLLGALFFYMAWDAAFGPPPDPKTFSKASTKMLAAAPKEFRIFFFATLGSIVAIPGVCFMWKLLANPSVISISPAGLQYESSPRRKKFISWAEMKDVTVHRGAAHIRGETGSINLPLFIHGVGRQEIMRDVEQHRPDLVKKPP